jgi:very-short-patch-repair endonuclease
VDEAVDPTDLTLELPDHERQPEAAVFEEGVRGVGSVPANDRSRPALVREAARRWRSQLIDLGGRNTLLYYRDLRAGTLDVGSGEAVALAALLGGRAMPLRQLFTDREAHAQALKRARTIRNKARELSEERGIQSCYLAIGMATWANPKGVTGGAVPAAPVLLRPALLRARGAAEDDFELTVAGDVEVNPTLLHLLAEDFGVTVDADDLEELIDYSAGFDPSPVYERLVKEAAGRVRGFMVVPRSVLGTFSYAKLPMVTDLLNAEDVLTGHDVIAAIAGDRDAQRSLRPEGNVIDPHAPDLIAPHDEFLVLDADSSQNYAINAILAGQHSVIKGPPGTGKSQTIANLIATLVARGKRVLFVAEKRAAITAVTDRLTRRGLGHLVMDVHDGAASRRRVAADLKAAFDSASRVALPDLTVLHETLAARRFTLNNHADALHARREPWGVSVFEAQAALAALTATIRPMTQVRLRGPVLAALDAATFRRTREQLRDFATLRGFTLSEGESGWTGALVRTPEQTQRAFDLAERLGEQTLPAARPALVYVIEQTGLRAPVEIENWRHVFAFLDAVSITLRTYKMEIFRSDLAVFIAATADRAWRREHAGHPGVEAGWLARRALRKQAAQLWRAPGKPGRRQLFEGLSAALAQREQWARAATDQFATNRPAGFASSSRTLTGQPRLPAELDRARAAFDALDTEVMALSAFVPRLPLSTMDLDRLGRVLAGLAGDERTLRKVPRINELTATFNALGLDPLIADLEGRRPDADLAGAVFEACWYASILQHLNFADPRIGTFDGPLHSRTVDEFREADSRHIDATAVRVLRAVAEHITEARDEYPDESRLVEHQANLKRRHLPVRQLFATAPHMLTALKPCWAMSPLVVSQLLPADGQYFDVVVFDEASQVTPADAVPALVRGRQVVVAGDEHQLPPTAFFTAPDDGSADPLGVTAGGEIDLSLTAGYESILDVLTALLPAYLLRWHYRSQDERLIAFSNAHIYDGSLVTFPGTAGASCLGHVPVKHIAGDDHVDSVTAEVDRVVQLIVQHAILRPNESLGVITMGITHAERIDLALRAVLSARPELHGFFAENAPEPFFVKNLERVQGDERDAVILSIGYGKNAAGKLLYRFGPLLLNGGERRLNVAITRARRRMTVVSAFTAADMDPARTTSEGVRLLRSFLAFAESGGNTLGPAAAERPPLNAFELDVRDRLAAAGIPVTPQYGVAGYFIDFAAAHPTLPDEMVLAIETDGATYHSSGTARDRDRLRQEQLQRLGWRFHRIWSTDWFADPQREVARLKLAYDEAVAAVDAKQTDEPTVVLLFPTPRPVVEASPESAARPAPRPAVPPGRSIAEYSRTELVALIRWIESDTLLRTEEEALEETRRQLGFKRGGSRINAAILGALAEARGELSTGELPAD